MRILFVAPYLPSPIRVRPYHWIRALSRLGQHIRLVALQPPEDRWLAEVPVRDCCESVSIFPLGRLRTVLNAARALPRNVPLQAAYSLHPAAERCIASQAALGCDVVHVEHLRGALLTRRVRGVPRVIDAVDSITALFEQARHQAPSWRHRLLARADLERTRRFEASVPTRFERVVVTAPHDAVAFQTLAGRTSAHRVVTVPNGVDLEHFRPGDRPREPATVLFTGKMSYHANEAAALRLVHRVMPRVWSRLPDARVVIAGKDPSPAIRQMACDSRVTVTGFVEDLRPLFWSATVVVAPLVYATGIQNKVLEAMACGVPVVASSTAGGGISAVNGRDLLIGRDDTEIAEHALRLIRDVGMRKQIGFAGRQYVAAHHDWFEMGRRLIAVYEDARAARRRCA
jgi:glycosyltransferase involved in cell wall biosynthesis